MSKTSISSIVCFDIIDFAKKSAKEKKSALAQFKKLLELAIVDIPQQDIQVTDTDHGAIVMCEGALESALEDALFIALTVRDEVLGRNAEGEEPLYLLIGINLGSVKVKQNQNSSESPIVDGEGLAEVESIMSFANPNQILVSKAYHEMASKLTLEIAQMFEKYDMHAYEDDIYAVRMLSEKPVEPVAATVGNTETSAGDSATLAGEQTSQWQMYFLPILLAIIALFVIIKWSNPTQESETIELPEQEAVMMDTTETDNTVKEVVIDDVEASTEETETKRVIEQKTTPVAKKKAKATTQKKTNTTKPVAKVEEATEQTSGQETESYDSVVVPVTGDEAVTTKEDKSSWEKFKDSIKQGAETTECTQAQRVLSQCE